MVPAEVEVERETVEAVLVVAAEVEAALLVELEAAVEALEVVDWVLVVADVVLVVLDAVLDEVLDEAGELAAVELVPAAGATEDPPAQLPIDLILS